MSKPHKPDRRKAALRLIALILCVLLAGSAVVAALISVAYAEEGSWTELNLTVDEGAQGVRAAQTTRYVNRTGARLDEVMFSLQAGALRRSWTAPVDESDTDGAYPEGFNLGGALLYRVLVNGERASWGVQGEAESFLRVACSLAPGDAAEFTFEYEILLPTAHGFLGAGDVGWRLSFFYPAPLVYDPALEQFDAVPVSAVGGCLYFDEQDFRVTVDAPDTWLVASGGESRVEPAADGRAVTRIALDGARSLALSLSRRYSVYEREVNGVRIALYTLNRAAAARVLDAAEQAVAAFGDLLGGVPRARLTLAEADAPGNDASHDAIVLLDAELFGLTQRGALEREVVFGIAKQWFGVSVNANPAREPWLSDALSRYLTLLYYESVYGYDRYLAELNKNSLDALNVTLPGTLTVDSYASEFRSRGEYETVIFGRGAAALHEMRMMLGADTLHAALAQYYQQNAHGIAGIAQFAAALNRASGKEVDMLLMDTLTRMGERGGQILEWYE